MFQSKPEIDATVERIKQVLVDLPIGKTAPYSALSDAAGFDITENRFALSKARNRAEEESGGLFETVRGYGVRRLPSEHIPDVGLHAVRKVRRAAKRGVKRLSGVRVNDIPELEKHRLMAHKSQLGAIALVADGRKTVSIAAVSNGLELPPRDAILALFGKEKGGEA